MLSAYFISNLITAVLNCSLGIFVYLKNKKNIVNISFALMNLSIAVWALGFALAVTAPTKDWGLFWIRILNVGCIPVPIFFLHFVFSLLKIDKRERITLIIAYTFNFFILIVSFSSLFIEDIRPKLSFNYYAIPGPLYFLIVLMFPTYAIYGFYKLFI
jgi:hypothetical protein